jgi:hypothetical protein
MKRKKVFSGKSSSLKNGFTKVQTKLKRLRSLVILVLGSYRTKIPFTQRPQKVIRKGLENKPYMHLAGSYQKKS